MGGGGGSWAERGDRGGMGGARKQQREMIFGPTAKYLGDHAELAVAACVFPSIKLIRSCVALTPRCFLDIISSCT